LACQTDEVVVTEISTERVVLPLRETFRTAIRQTDAVEALQVSIHTDDGRVGVGYGTATPAITGDSIESMERHIAQRGRPLTVGRTVDTRMFDEIAAQTRWSPSGTAALDLALHGLSATPSDSSARVQTSVTISAGSIKEMTASALRRLDLGFTVLKLKLGADPAQDLMRLHAVTNAVEDRAEIWVDANQGWTMAETLSIIDRAQDRGYAPSMLEQPVHANSFSDLAEIAKRVLMPVTADESAKTVADIERIAGFGGVEAINIKFMKFGGITGAKIATQRALDLGLSVMIGSMMEHPSSVAAAVRFAASLPQQIHDLDAAWWFTDPIGLTYADSYVHV
jgi:L-Ala-D/L-Glu epimerase